MQKLILYICLIACLPINCASDKSRAGARLAMDRLRSRAKTLGVQAIHTGDFLNNKIDISHLDKAAVLQALFKKAVEGGRVVGCGIMSDKITRCEADWAIKRALRDHRDGCIDVIYCRSINVNFKSNILDVTSFNEVNGLGAAHVAISELESQKK